MIYYERLYEGDNSKFNFKRFYECLSETGDDKSAEKLLKKTASRNKYDNEYTILLAKFYEERNQKDKADKIYDQLIEELQASSRNVIGLYNLFKSQGFILELYH